MLLRCCQQLRSYCDDVVCIHVCMHVCMYVCMYFMEMITVFEQI